MYAIRSYYVVSLFPENLENIKLEEFFKGINKVENSLIRIEADELTYSLHIMIRYEIEKQIFQGDIEIDHLPEIWNNKVKEYLGIDVESDKDRITSYNVCYTKLLRSKRPFRGGLADSVLCGLNRGSGLFGP